MLGYRTNTFQDYFQFKVCGTLLGEYDESLFWRLKNLKPDFETESGKNSLKIMCLTDSVSVMYGGKGYPNILQDLLTNAIPRKNPIVFNGGVPGYTSFQGLKYFTNELLFYKPDIVTVCYGWNDHWQSGNKLPDKLQKSPKNTFIRNIISNSRILNLINSLAMKIAQSLYKGIGSEQFVRVPIEDYKYNLSKFADICKNKNILIIFMTSPYLDSSYSWIPMHRRYNSIVRHIAKEKNIPIIDFEEVFKKRKDLFIDPENDKCHYNWEGSKIVAQELADTIVRQLGL